MTDKRKINWDKKIEYAQRKLKQNKALIEDTYKGTKSQKAKTWTIKQKKNNGEFQ